MPYELRNDPLLRDAPERDGYKVLPPCVLFERLGVGGMGTVYRGTHLRFGFDVAVKCLNPSLAAPGSPLITRFVREARIAAGIHHQNLVQVYDVLQSSGVHYLVMEYVMGETARQRVERKGALAEAEACRILFGAASGLAAAHHKRIVHRDVKPDNILVAHDGSVKVSDLGLAKVLERTEGHTLTQGGAMGTPQYMAPEQWDDPAHVGPRADVWALGAVLYFLLSGTNAIATGSIAQICRRIREEPFPDLRVRLPSLSPEVARILEQCVHQEPARRYAHCGELARDLQRLPCLEGVTTLDVERSESVFPGPLVSPPPEASLARIRTEFQAELPTPTLVHAPALTASVASSTSSTNAVAEMPVAPPAARVEREARIRPRVAQAAWLVATFVLVISLAVAGWLFVGRDQPESLAGETSALSTHATTAQPEPELGQREPTHQEPPLAPEAISIVAAPPENRAHAAEPMDSSPSASGPSDEAALGGAVALDTSAAPVPTSTETTNAPPASSDEATAVVAPEPQGNTGIDAAPSASDAAATAMQAEPSMAATESPNTRHEVLDPEQVAAANVEPVPTPPAPLPVAELGLSCWPDVAVRLRPGTEVRLELDLAPKCELSSFSIAGVELDPTSRRCSYLLEAPSGRESCSLEWSATAADGRTASGRWEWRIDSTSRVPGARWWILEPGDAASGWAARRVLDPLTGLPFRWIPGGTFNLGALDGDTAAGDEEKPARAAVRIKDAFYMSENEVSWRAWRRCMGQLPKHIDERRLDFPITALTPREFAFFCERAGYRLPWEVEWEYAARCGRAGELFGFGDRVTLAQANFRQRFKQPGNVRRADEGELNGFGLRNMHGNVREWCADPYDERFYATAPANSSMRNLDERLPDQHAVIRGGSAHSYERSGRSSARASGDPSRNRADDLGFRVVVDLAGS